MGAGQTRFRDLKGFGAMATLAAADKRHCHGPEEGPDQIEDKSKGRATELQLFGRVNQNVLPPPYMLRTERTPSWSDTIL